MDATWIKWFGDRLVMAVLAEVSTRQLTGIPYLSGNGICAALEEMTAEAADGAGLEHPTSDEVDALTHRVWSARSSVLSERLGAQRRRDTAEGYLAHYRAELSAHVRRRAGLGAADEADTVRQRGQIETAIARCEADIAAAKLTIAGIDTPAGCVRCHTCRAVIRDDAKRGTGHRKDCAQAARELDGDHLPTDYDHPL
jgi:hypothetical protein